MELVLKTTRDKIGKLKDLLLKDNVVSRANILFLTAEFEGKTAEYARVLGDEVQCKKALELSKGMAEEASAEEREEVLKKLAVEGEQAAEWFGAILG